MGGTCLLFPFFAFSSYVRGEVGQSALLFLFFFFLIWSSKIPEEERPATPFLFLPFPPPPCSLFLESKDEKRGGTISFSPFFFSPFFLNGDSFFFFFNLLSWIEVRLENDREQFSPFPWFFCAGFPVPGLLFFFPPLPFVLVPPSRRRRSKGTAASNFFPSPRSRSGLEKNRATFSFPPFFFSSSHLS